MKKEDVKTVVRNQYASVVKQRKSCCGPASSCCDSGAQAALRSKSIGYSDRDLESVPDNANLGLGCGNPIALASLQKGEVVLDLGSGAGFDCFLAGDRVGPEGKVIGVDMTPEMLEQARENARKGNYTNVEFRLGEIESLPVADNSVDIVISNCVINLSPDKEQVFREAFRALKPGGRIMISDLVLTKELPEAVKKSAAAYVGCLAGAMLRDDYLGAIGKAGFTDVRILEETSFPVKMLTDDSTVKMLMETFNIPSEGLAEAAESVRSARVYAVKPPLP